MSEEKTNAMRILDRAKLPYAMRTYEVTDGAIDGVSVAKKIGEDPARVFKTLVTMGHSRKYYVFVLPVAEELDLKAAAKSVREKSVELIPVAEIQRVTGYIRGGCSPIGMKKPYGTRVDESAKGFGTIFFSGGRIGTQIEMNAEALCSLIGGEFERLTKNV